jgi:hypothetical protein
MWRNPTAWFISWYGYLLQIVSFFGRTPSIIDTLTKERFPEDACAIMINWWIATSMNKILNFEDATIASQGQKDKVFKDDLKRRAYQQPVLGDLFDMAM